MLYWSYLVLIGAAALTQLLSILRGLYYLRVEFPCNLRPLFRADRDARGLPAPAVSIFVPCKGVSKELEGNIHALIRQDYPAYRLFLITESEEDPAAPILAALASENDRVHHVIAGQATHCCQKNHNLLKGIDFALRENIAGEIYVFVDSDIRTESDWLSNMTLPLGHGNVFAVSGFRSFVPGHYRFAEHLYAAFNALQALAMTENRYAGMWGGSMALCRDAFEAYAVAEKWSTAMVDDLSLSSIIKRHNLKRIFSPDCLVNSNEDCLQLNGVLRWFIRQIQYAAVYLRTYTCFGLCLNSILLLGMVMLPATLALTFVGRVSWMFAAYHMLFYILTATNFCLLSGFRKQKKYELRWIVYAPCFLILGLYCGCIGFLSKRLVWADIVYHVNQHGEVLTMER